MRSLIVWLAALGWTGLLAACAYLKAHECVQSYSGAFDKALEGYLRLGEARLQEGVFDEAQWVAYTGSIYDLPEEKRPLLEAPRAPRPPDVLIEGALVKISERIARHVGRFYR